MSGKREKHATAPGEQAHSALERGREAYRRRAWTEAHRSLALAEQAEPLAGDDLERLAMAALLIGREDEALGALERCHHAHLGRGDNVPAARSALWLGFQLVSRGENGRAGGWFGRAERLLERVEHDAVEKGYLLVPAGFRHLAAGDREAAFATAAAAEIGDRFGDADLVAIARNLQGGVLMRQGKVEDGLALLDEVMVAVTSRELSPLITGLIYCSAIGSCQQVYAVDRAREWTSALAAWCAEQPEVVAFSGRCLVHRAEIMQLNGAWRDAIEEARRASERLSQGGNAAELFVSEKTVDRHMSNIFTKLDVSSRTAAAAFAFERKLV